MEDPMMKPIGALAVAALLFATPAMGQQHQHGQRGEGMDREGGMQMGMMQGMQGHDGPGMVLRLEETLELTADQVARIEALRERTHEQHQPHMQAAMQARHQAMTILHGESPDLSAYEARLEEAASHHVMGEMVMARAMQDLMAILDARQQDRMRVLMSAMMEMRGGMMEGMRARRDRRPMR